ncbi:MAG: 2-oxo acid dehydrogenase subunit E2 [Wigglesworthia glossinidia]|nr:2-oxo acid dehydrogenase subunit E2 [Wigglesworthia glossinidia]
MNSVIKIPDIGVEDAEVTEILASIGEKIKIEQPLITIEGDKASMQVPAPISGILKKIMIKIGDRVSTDQEIMIFEKNSEKNSVFNEKLKKSKNKPVKSEKNIQKIYSNMLGILEDSKILDVLVSEKDSLKIQCPVLIIQNTRGMKKITSSITGKIQTIYVKIGDKIDSSTLLYSIYSDDVSLINKNTCNKDLSKTDILQKIYNIYASPLIRRIALKYSIDLSKIDGSGRKGRITRIDLDKYIYDYKNLQLNKNIENNSLHLEESKYEIYGKIKIQELTKIKKISGNNLLKNWTTVPHITQFDHADINELEIFRKKQNKILQEKNEIKITILAFIIKAVIATLKVYPQFNSSLSSDGKRIILKKYFNIGIAVNTQHGLMVPIIFNADTKGIIDLSQELFFIAKKARLGKLSGKDMQGGCFTISNLGGIGGKEFTPIINVPEVAILGISRSNIQAIWDGNNFIPKLMLPLSLSYDHRVIDGVEGAQFIQHLTTIISDIRSLIL